MSERGPALPVVQPRWALRVRRPSPWRTAVLVGVHLVMAAHIAHWLTAGSTLTPVEPSEAMELAKHGVVNAGAIFFAAAIVLTALFGRFFCGWGCHLVALQDLCRWLLIKLGLRPRALRSRALLLVPLAAFVYMFLWPAVYRVWVGLPLPPLRLELMTDDLWATFPGWAWASVTFVVCGFAAVFVLGAKGFCTYACPYGAAFALADRVAPVRVRVTDACQACARCTAACTSNVRVHEEVATWGAVVDPGCMKCLDCVAACPNDALYVGPGRPAVATRARTGERPRQRWLPASGELVAAGVFVIAFAILRGLYGQVPFLLSLGAAAMVAALAVTGLGVVRRRSTWLGPVRLARSGVMGGREGVFLVVGGVVLALLGHSAVVHWWAATGHSAFARTATLRRASLDLDRPLEPLGEGEAELVGDAVRRLDAAQRWGLIHDPTLSAELAWLHFLRRDRDGLRRALEVALADRPGAADLHLLAGRSLAEDGQIEAALGAYGRALELDPMSAPAALGLGTLLGRSGRVEEASEVFGRAADLAPEHLELRYNLGVARAMLGDAPGAVAAFDAVLAGDPEHLRAMENLAGILLGTGRAAEAVPLLERAVELSPEDITTHLMAVQALAVAGDLERAREHLRTALELEPGHPMAMELARRIGMEPVETGDG